MPDLLTIDIFAGRETERFRLAAGDQALDVELVEVTRLGPTPSEVCDIPGISRRDASFSLVFRGPNEMPLDQHLYPLAHDDLGDLSSLFLVPIRADEQGRYYEAVFN